MDNDDDLRARFEALASEETSAAPPYMSPARVIRVMRWYSPRRLALAGASLAAAMLMLTVGLVWGASTGYASARVAGERERKAIAASTVGVTRQLAALRLELTRTREGLVRLAASQGTVPHASLLAAEAEVDSMTANLVRIERSVSAASASAPEGPVFAILRTMPVRTALAALTCGAEQSKPHAASLQKAIPVVDLPPASVHTTEALGGILGLKQASDGKVLVNDARRRQLKLYDSTLSTFTIVRDSAPGSATSYGRLGTPLIPYLGDSSLITEWTSQTMLLIDGHGRFVRGVDLPAPLRFGYVNSGYTAVDSKGRLIVRGDRPTTPRTFPNGRPSPAELAEHPLYPLYVDSMPILRADLEQRRVDTIGRIARPLMKVTTERSGDGHTTTVFTLDPLQSVDEFAVLSTGSVAIVRGHDYHVDLLQGNDQWTASAKLAFDWKRRTDDDKTRLADSVRGAQNGLLANGYPFAEISFTTGPCDLTGPPPGAVARGGNATARPDTSGATGPRTCTRFEPNLVASALGVQRTPRPPMADLYRAGGIDDFEAPLRPGSTVADLDGNLWILPRTTTLSKKGELVYDVVNAKGELFERVRLPLGRAIAGFAKGGVVYLTSGDLTNGFTLERTKLPSIAQQYRH